MGNRLDGKVCIITGAGSGMGRASAVEMAAQGGKVVVTDVNVVAGEETVAAISDAGGEALFIGCDLRKPEAIKAMIDAAAQHYGRIKHQTDVASGIGTTYLSPF